MKKLESGKQLILFDGVCNLCNSAIQYVIKHDKNDVFRFAPLQSKLGQQLIERFDLNTNEMDSIILFSEEKGLKVKSSAALHISKHLGFPRNLMSVFLVVPAVIRNWVYDFVARNRYKWYGKKEECMIPTPELKAKFMN